MAVFRFRESMTPRQKQILVLVVEHYIAQAEAVGSRTLAEMMDNAVSSATIRSELGMLADMGLLQQPHTSAGRVPTVSGYRFYVDNLMEKSGLPEDEQRRIDAALDIKGGSIEEIVEKAVRALSALTQCAAVSAAPVADTYLRRVEFFPMTPRSAVVAVMTSSGLIKSRMAALDSDITSGCVYAFLQLINSQLGGRNLSDISPVDFIIISQADISLAIMFTPVLDAVAELIAEACQPEIYVSGERYLLEQTEPENALELIRFLSAKDLLFDILRLYSGATRVIMGSETGYAPLRNVSLVLSGYSCREKQNGSVGVICSPRSDYAKLVSRLEYFSAGLGGLIGNYFVN